MNTVEIRADIVHHLNVARSGPTLDVQIDCHHGSGEFALKPLGVSYLGCREVALRFETLLVNMKGASLREAAKWAAIPVEMLGRSRANPRPWCVGDLRRWRVRGVSASEAARYVRKVPLRVDRDPGPGWSPKVHEILVHCGNAVHRVLVEPDKRNRLSIVLANHDEMAEAVLHALGGRRSACAKIVLAARRLEEVIPVAHERAHWIAIGIRRPSELAEWRSSGVRSPARAAQWLKFTDLAMVAEWKKLGFTQPKLASPWGRAGFSPSEANDWVHAGKNIDEATEWREHGALTARGFTEWGMLGVTTPREIRPWLEIGVKTSGDAKQWAGVGVRSPNEVRSWRRAGVTGTSDALAWARLGVEPSSAEIEITRWRLGGITSGRDALAWYLAGAIPEEIPRWKSNGIPDGPTLALRRTLGIETEQGYLAWKAAGFRDDADIQLWVTAGARSVEDLAAWQEAGVVDPRVAISWVQPHFASGPEEVAAWRTVGVDSPSRARDIQQKKGLPAPVARVRKERLAHLRGEGFVLGRVEPSAPREGAHPSATLTERYCYAFGYSCRFEAATSIVEVDFDAEGREVSRQTCLVASASRRSRSGFAYDRCDLVTSGGVR